MATFLNVLTIVIISGFITIITIEIAIRLRPGYLNLYSASSRRQILWCLALSPWLVGTCAAIIAVAPDSYFFLIPDIYNFLRWHHPQVFVMDSWHGLTILISASVVCVLLVRGAVRLRPTKRRMRLLQSLAESTDNGFYLLDTHVLMAFTAGLFRPRCYITSALRHSLNDDEFAIVQLHEKEHARGFDPFKKACFQVFTTFFLPTTARYLNHSMAMTIEQCADHAVSRVVSDKSLIASTLVKVKRLTSALDISPVCHYGMDYVQERICYLLSDCQGKVFPYFWVTTSVVAMSVICAVSADMFHHSVEYLFSP